MPNEMPKVVSKVGNLTRDPVLKFAEKTGQPFAHTAIACERPGPSGGWDDKVTEFYDLTLFGSTAENACVSLQKGNRVVVIGRPEVKEYETSDGEKRQGKSILANHIGADLRWAAVSIVKNVKGRDADDFDTTMGGQYDEF